MGENHRPAKKSAQLQKDDSSSDEEYVNTAVSKELRALTQNFSASANQAYSEATKKERIATVNQTRRDAEAQKGSGGITLRRIDDNTKPFPSQPGIIKVKKEENKVSPVKRTPKVSSSSQSTFAELGSSKPFSQRSESQSSTASKAFSHGHSHLPKRVDYVDTYAKNQPNSETSSTIRPPSSMVSVSSSSSVLSRNMLKYTEESGFNTAVTMGSNGGVRGLKAGSYSWIGPMPDGYECEELVTAITLYDTVSAVWLFPTAIKQFANVDLDGIFNRTQATTNFVIESKEFYLENIDFGDHGRFCEQIRELSYRGRITPILFEIFLNKKVAELNFVIELPCTGNLRQGDKTLNTLRDYETPSDSWKQIVRRFSSCDRLRRLTIDVRANKTMTYRDIVVPVAKNTKTLSFLQVVVALPIDPKAIDDTHSIILGMLEASCKALVIVDKNCKEFFDNLKSTLSLSGGVVTDLKHWIHGSCLVTAIYKGIEVEHRSRTVYYAYRDDEKSLPKPMVTIPELARLRVVD